VTFKIVGQKEQQIMQFYKQKRESNQEDKTNKKASK